MPAPVYSAADLLAAFQNLLPRGRVWPRDPDSTQSGVLLALMPTWQRLCEAAAALIPQAFPATADELLPEWQATLGLPDPCGGPSPTLQQEQGQVVARFTDGGGQSIPYYVAFAKSLGYDITITEYAPFRVGINRVGQPISGPQWAYYWTVNAPSITVTYFRAGRSAVGEPIASIGNTVLQCELTRIAPAHTTVTFNFGAG